MTGETLFKAEDLAKYLDCSEATVRRMTSKKTIPHIKMGHLVRYRKNDVDAWLFRKTVHESTKKTRGLAAVLVLAALLHCGNAFASIDAALPALAQKIILAESSGNPRAVGDNGRSRGLMQIQEGTWRRHTRDAWSRAFEPAFNYKVGLAELRRIVRVYRSRGIEPSVAYVIWTYNTGTFIKKKLPKFDRHGKPHPFTWNHPNEIYRGLYREALK